MYRAPLLMLFVVSLCWPAFHAEAQDEPSFTYRIEDGSALVGQVGHVVVTIKAREGFRPNEDYRNKAKKLAVNPEEGAQIELEKPVLDGVIQGDSIIFQIPIRATQAGTYRVTGDIRFSVCNDTACHIKKKSLHATFTGK